MKKKTKDPENPDFFYDEPDRERIYVWSQRRFKQNQSRLFNHARLYLIDTKIIKCFIGHFNPIFALNVVLSIVVTVICVLFKIDYKLPGIFYLQIFSLSVSFLIDADFTRRENALMQLAELKSSCLSTFLISKSWRGALKVTDANYHSVKNLLIKLMIHINEYLQTTGPINRKFISNVIYEGLNDLSVLMEKYGMDKLGIQVDTHTPIIWFIASRFNSIFERLKVYREYRSPLTQRSFTKVMAFILPLIFAPWFAGFVEKSAPHLKWLALLYNGLFTFILNGQTIITDRLFDPFVSISVDSIDLSKTLTWIHYAIMKIENRNYTILREPTSIPCGIALYVDKNSQNEVPIDVKEYKPFRVDIKSVDVRGKNRILMEMHSSSH